jgi:hypothetical protein
LKNERGMQFEINEKYPSLSLPLEIMRLNNLDYLKPREMPMPKIGVYFIV